MGGEGSETGVGPSRRRVLRRVGAGLSVTVGGLSGCGGRDDGPGPNPPDGEDRTPTDPPATDPRTEQTPTESGGATSGVRGAVYFPARTFNHYQAWRVYDPGETVRDLSYADSLGVNALRVLVSYEFWREDPLAFERRFDHMLSAAAETDIRILPVLFESIGVEPTDAALSERDPLHNGAVRSPSHDVLQDPRRWDGPRRFVSRLVERYAGHDGLLAVEIMNEPGEWVDRVEFCRAMLRAARDADGNVPLTMGCKNLPNNFQYENPELDVLQFHYNLPPTADHMRLALSEAAAVSRETATPVWLTEWQRTREEPPNKFLPNYSSLAATVRGGDIDGDFFWQLMLKPAYGYVQRTLGRLNGVFHEDGAVYSLEDARAISGDEDAFWRSRQAWPEWAVELRDSSDSGTGDVD